MTDLPAVSVVIPTFRAGDYLREAVASVLNQSFVDFELIVVADGCEDDLADVEMLDKRVHIVRQRNRGESVARNVGIRAARSDLIAFLDDDDRMLPSRLAVQFEAMAGRPDCGICHSQFRVIDEHGIPGRVGHAADVQYLDLLRGAVHILMPTIMVRKAVLEETGSFDSTLKTGQDLDLIYRISRESTLFYLPDILTEYRRHRTNASGNVRQDALVLRRLLSKHLNLAEQLDQPDRRIAAKEGIAWSERYEATGAVLEMRTAWKQRDISTMACKLGAAARLSPRETLSDLIGSRWHSWRDRHSLGGPGQLP